MNKNNAQYNNEDIEKVRLICKKLYSTNNPIHIYISKDKKRKTELECQITGIYPRFINVNYYENNKINSLTISYIDIMIRNIVIRELESIAK